MNIFKLPSGDLRIQLEDSDDRDELEKEFDEK